MLFPKLVWEKLSLEQLLSPMSTQQWSCQLYIMNLPAHGKWNATDVACLTQKYSVGERFMSKPASVGTIPYVKTKNRWNSLDRFCHCWKVSASNITKHSAQSAPCITPFFMLKDQSLLNFGVHGFFRRTKALRIIFHSHRKSPVAFRSRACEKIFSRLLPGPASLLALNKKASLYISEI